MAEGQNSGHAGEMPIAEAVERLKNMYDNLRGAPGLQLRKDRAALRAAIMALGWQT